MGMSMISRAVRYRITRGVATTTIKGSAKLTWLTARMRRPRGGRFSSPSTEKPPRKPYTARLIQRAVTAANHWERFIGWGPIVVLLVRQLGIAGGLQGFVHGV